ncbi:MAG: hypothetical protein CMJ86_04085 [Planctomycetes bacterium]|nr:hypothetical protein [Planctomycetota bacterium]
MQQIPDSTAFGLLGLLALCLPSPVLAAIQDPAALERGLDSVSVESLEADLNFIASDEMRGRDTPSNEQRIAARFLRDRMQRLGFDSGARYGFISEYHLSFLQLDSEASHLTVGETQLVFGRHYVFSRMNDMGDLTTEGDLLSIGEGRVSDLRKNALKGKWAVCQSTGKSMRRLIRQVIDAGAIGLLILPQDGDDVLARHKKSVDSMKAGRLMKYQPVEFPTLTMTASGAQALLAACGLDELPDLGKSLRAEASEVRRIIDPRGHRYFENVIAFWPGSDPELSKETIIISAHYDHVGVRGGEVYNGADDNGSGTVGVLGIADALAAYGPMKRSVALIWVSAEEKGLLGSRCWTQRPWLPAGCRPIANINIDMIGRNAPDEILITPTKNGSVSKHYNGLVRLIESFGKQEGFRRFKSADDYWRRSDHMNFADNLGLPVTFLFADVHKDYHKHTDEVHLIDFDKMRRVVRMIMRALDAMQASSLEISAKAVPSQEAFEAQVRRGMVADDLERWRLIADHYQRASGKYPRNLSELMRSEVMLESGLSRPGLERDPWGNMYELKSGDDGVLLTCEGSDGRKGGEGEAADTVVR